MGVRIALGITLKILAILLLLSCCSTFGDSYEWMGLDDIVEPVCREPDSYELHENCTLYYRCSNSIPTLMSCNGGLYFNPLPKECDHPDNVKDCVNGIRPIEGGTTTTSTTQPITTTRTTTTTTPITTTTTPIPTTTTRTTITTTRITTTPTQTTTRTTTTTTPTPTTTTRTTTTTTTTTPTPTTTTRTTTTTTTTTPTPTTTTRTTITTTPITSTRTTTTPTATTTPVPLCRPDGIYYIAKEGTCKQYIMCSSGSPFVLTCTDGTIFNPAESKCVLEHLYDCPYTTTTTTTTTVAPEFFNFNSMSTV